MSPSCPKCWDGVCSCGYMYEHFTKQELESLIKILQKQLEEKSK